MPVACSTCHVIVDEKWFAKLPPASASEEDMLDLTYGVTRASRLGCQITLTADLDGITLRLPQAGGDRGVLLLQLRDPVGAVAFDRLQGGVQLGGLRLGGRKLTLGVRQLGGPDNPKRAIQPPGLPS